MRIVRTKYSVLRVIIFFILWELCLSIPFRASSAGQTFVPDILKPWVGWVIHDKSESLECIPLFNDSASWHCTWPTAIDLDLNSNLGRFTQKWRIYHEGYIPLPNCTANWPVNVMIDGYPAIVVQQQDLYGNTIPHVNIMPGVHTLSGEFVWKKLPEYIQVPSESALVTLRMNGVPVELPNLDSVGRLWLKRDIREKKEENRLKVECFRLIDDDIPSRVILYATLDVAGTPREVRLGPIYSPKEFLPLSLESPLPSRLESDGTIRIQVKPGRYSINLAMRHLQPLAKLAFDPPGDGYWPKQEIWSVLRHPDLRIVEISGVPAIDPKMTSLPEEWKSYPAYVMKPEDTMIFNEIKRGDSAPPPDQLDLYRTLWLSFDGTGYTVQDKITGKKNSSWRLEMDSLMLPGKVTVDGIEQLITRRESKIYNDSYRADNNGLSHKPESGGSQKSSSDGFKEDNSDSYKAGVELRHGILDLVAESRSRSSVYNIPATGWDHTFQHVAGVLNLPPGWKLIAAQGIDNIPGTWVKRWSLLDFFIVLIFTIATAKLFSRSLAIVGFITLVLLYHEPGAPRYVWLFLVTGFALLKHIPDSISDTGQTVVIPADCNIANGMQQDQNATNILMTECNTQAMKASPSGKFRKIVMIYQFLAVMILFLISVPYAVNSLRVGIYPQLEKNWISMNDFFQGQTGASLSYSNISHMEDQKGQGIISPKKHFQQSQMDSIDSKEFIPEAEVDISTSEVAMTAQAPKGVYNSVKQFSRVGREKVFDMATNSNAPLGYRKYDEEFSKYQTKDRGYDPESLTQTGPGLPLWKPFQSVKFSWTGPVEPGQMISFTLIGPFFNLVLAFLRVALIILLFMGMVIGSGYKNNKLTWENFKLKQLSRKFKSSYSTLVILPFLVLIPLFSPFMAYAGEIPSPQMLEELQRRLLEKDDCFPFCADISQMEISIGPQQLSMTMYVDAAIDTAIPLPGNIRHWLPREVLVNNANSEALVRSGENLWVMVPAGKNILVAKGRIGNHNTFQLPLPLKPHSVKVDDSTGWSVQGIQPDGSLDDQIQFQRIKGDSEEQEDILETGLFPSFALVERTLLLGLDWKVETTVQRLTPSGSAIVLTIPLLAGESVITEGVHVKNGMASVTLNASEQSFSFLSFLKASDTIRLYHAFSVDKNSPESENYPLFDKRQIANNGNTPKNLEWTEVWKLDVSPVFHVETQGIPVIMHQNNDRWYPTWHPWPGEEVILNISRPKGIGGQTLTIKKSVLDLKPGQRSTSATLLLEISSSQGGQHTILIPERAELEELSVNGKVQLIRQDGQKVVLPITPGNQDIKLIWREGVGIVPLYHTSKVDLGISSVNAAVDLHISSDRWPLFVGGQHLVGPAVLFWSVIIVVFIVSAGLAMTCITPLKFHEWFGLGIGMSMSNPVACFFVAAWLVVLDMRKKWGARVSTQDKNNSVSRPDSLNVKALDDNIREQKIKDRESQQISKLSRVSSAQFNLMQLGIAILTFISIISIVFAVSKGLIGHPSMNITGNGSTGTFLRWYHDTSNTALPVAWVFSLPMIAYRIAMLLWALWLSFWLLKILKWGWFQFTTPIIWATASDEKHLSEKKKRKWMGIKKFFKSRDKDENRAE